MRKLLVFIGFVFSTSFGLEVKYLPTPITGTYLGEYSVVQCLNCVIGMENAVRITLQDSSGEYTSLTMKASIWGSIKKPIEERNISDYNNECFYFKYKDKDTITMDGMVFVGQVKEVPCFPYEQRVKGTFPVYAPNPVLIDSLVKNLGPTNIKIKKSLDTRNLESNKIQEIYLRYLITQTKLQNQKIRFSGYMFMVSAASLAVGTVLGYTTYNQYKSERYTIPETDMVPIASAFFVAVAASGAGGYSLISINF